MKFSKISLAALGAVAMSVGIGAFADKPAGQGTDKPAGWNQGGGEQDEALVFTKKFKTMTPEQLKKVRADGVAVFEVCSACHLPEGWGTKDGTFPQLAGQHVDVIIKQLADIRGKNRDNPTMYPFALPQEIKNAAPEVGGGPYAIAAVARYIHSIPMNPANGVGAGDNLELGAKLFKDNCVRCHGDEAQGNNDKYYPRIQGQHYKYLLRQFEWIRDKKRRNANPDMIKQIASFSDTDMKAVIDYVSRIKPPAKDLAPSADWYNPDFD